MINVLRRAIKASIPLRLRNHIRLLLGRHPAKLRDGFPDLKMVSFARGDVIIDGGAYVGDFAEAVLAYQPWAKIHAFEPQPAAFGVLQTRLAPFGDIELHNVALGRAKGHGDFFVRNLPTVSSFLVSGSTSWAAEWGNILETKEVLRVPIVTSSDYLQEQKIGHVRLLKLDVQGYELEVLAGAEPVLGRIDWIYTEARFDEGLYAGAPLINDIYGYLIQRGFKLHRIIKVSHDDKGNMQECDMLFERLS
jgi:FkbM family methyltransferase